MQYLEHGLQLHGGPELVALNINWYARVIN